MEEIVEPIVEESSPIQVIAEEEPLWIP